MTIVQLARMFLRFQGLLFLGTMVYECVGMSRDYATFVTHAITPEGQHYGTTLFWTGVLRTAVYALAALVLLAKTDAVIRLLAGKLDPERPAPNQSPETTRGAQP